MRPAIPGHALQSRQMSERRWLACLACLLLIGASLGIAAAGAAPTTAPDYEAERVDGTGVFVLEDMRGEVVLLNVWATWCKPCREEMPELQNLGDEYGGQGLNVIGVSVDVGGDDARINDFAETLGVTFPLVRDPDGNVSRSFRTSGVPETILIDRAGSIAFQWKGEMEAGSAGNRRIIEEALASDGEIESGVLPQVAGVSFVAAFVAGMLSVLSPCVFPLIPTYAAYITGISVEELTSRQQPNERRRVRRIALRNGLIFVCGFSLVFIALGASASAIGGFLHDYRVWLARIGGLVLLVMGLHILGVLRISALDRVVRPTMGGSMRSAKPLGTLAIGMAFGAGWTPCIGPALASILTLAAVTASMGQGVALLSVYSLGLAVPFLLGTVMIDRFMRHRREFGPWLPRLERTSGVLVVGIAILMISGALPRLAEFSARFDPFA